MERGPKLAQVVIRFIATLESYPVLVCSALVLVMLAMDVVAASFIPVFDGDWFKYGLRVGVFSLPTFAALLDLLVAATTPDFIFRARPKQDFPFAFSVTYVGRIAIFAALQLGVFVRILGPNFHDQFMFTTAIALRLVLKGVAIPHTKRNAAIGVINIFTPWAFCDERVWQKSQRFAAPYYLAGGSLLLLAAFALSTRHQLDAITLITSGVSVIAIVGSFLIWRARLASFDGMSDRAPAQVTSR